MLQLKDLLALKIFLYILWPVSAVAATVSLGSSVETISVVSVCVTLMMSSLSGLTALLHQMRKDLMETGEIKHLGLYVTSKMLGSNVAGLLTLFFTEKSMDPNYQVASIIVAAFGGTVVLEKALIDKLGKK